MSSVTEAGRSIQLLGQIQRYRSEMNDINDTKLEINNDLQAIARSIAELDPESQSVKDLQKQQAKSQKILDELDRRYQSLEKLVVTLEQQQREADQRFRHELHTEYPGGQG